MKPYPLFHVMLYHRVSVTFKNIFDAVERVAVDASDLHTREMYLFRDLLPCSHVNIALLENRSLAWVVEPEDGIEDLILDTV